MQKLVRRTWSTKLETAVLELCHNLPRLDFPPSGPRSGRVILEIVQSVGDRAGRRSRLDPTTNPVTSCHPKNANSSTEDSLKGWLRPL